MAAPTKRGRGRRPSRAALVRRWLTLGAVVLAAFLYYRPLQSYLHTRAALEQRRAEVRALRAQEQALRRRLAVSTSSEALAREARRLGLIQPGQHLYIVKGIRAWRRAHAATVAGDG